jgi:hypothetical protein
MREAALREDGDERRVGVAGPPGPALGEVRAGGRASRALAAEPRAGVEIRVPPSRLGGIGSGVGVERRARAEDRDASGGDVEEARGEARAGVEGEGAVFAEGDGEGAPGLRARERRAGEERQAARAEHARAGGEDGGDVRGERALAARAQVARGAGDDGRAQRDVGRRVRGRAEGVRVRGERRGVGRREPGGPPEELRAERARGRGGVEARRRGRGRRAGEEREEERVERAHRAPRGGSRGADCDPEDGRAPIGAEGGSEEDAGR